MGVGSKAGAWVSDAAGHRPSIGIGLAGSETGSQHVIFKGKLPHEEKK